MIDDVGRERFEAGIAAALELYLEELERRLAPGTVVPKPGIPELLARLAAEPSVTLGLLTGNLERGRAAEARAARISTATFRSGPSGAIPPTGTSFRRSRWSAPSRTPAAGSRASRS